MADLDDVDLGAGEPQESPPPAPRDSLPLGPIALVVALVAAIGLTGFFAFRKRETPGASPAATAAPTEAAPSASPTVAALPAGMPALDGSDELVRALAKGLSSHPQLGVWLAAKDLVRTLAVAVENVANGQTPRVHLGFLLPKEPFTVVQKSGHSVIDPKSYARYDDLTDGFASLDAALCADVYRRLEPLFEAAYRDLGYPDGGFKNALVRAIAMLEAAPVLEGDVGLRPAQQPRLYVYEDERVEALTAAQKQLVRLGPRNVRKVQAKLRELRAAL